MKTALIGLLIVASALSFLATYRRTADVENERVRQAGVAGNWPFFIPIGTELDDSSRVFPLLLDAARQADVNVFLTCIAYDETERTHIAKYILLTRSTRFFDNFRLESGRLLTAEETQNSRRFVDSEATGDDDQVGTVREFAGEEPVVIKPLKEAYHRLPVAGEYRVEATDKKAYEKFVKAFVVAVRSRLAGHSSTKFVVSDFTSARVTGGETPDPGSKTDTFRTALAIVMGAIAVVCANYLFAESQRIGRPVGFDVLSVRLWATTFGKPVALAFVAATAASVVLTVLIVDTSFEFVAGVLRGIAYVAAVAILVMMATVLVFATFTVVTKGRHSRAHLRFTLIVNFLFKTAIAIIIVCALVAVFTQHRSVRNQERALAPWSRWSEYGVFYPTLTGNDQQAFQIGWPGPTEAEVYSLYPMLNRMGALFIQALDYEPASLLAPLQGIRSVLVNPNYLKAFPIRDSHGVVVKVPEQTSDWIVLVPSRYRGHLRDMRKYFRRQRFGGQGVEGAFQAERSLFRRAIPRSVRTQRIRIVWVSNGERLFSFDPLVFPDEQNVIIDPIVEVMTERNSLGVDRVNMMDGQGGSDPLKIRLLQKNGAPSMSMLRPRLKKLRLDDNLRRVVTVYGAGLERIRAIEKNWSALEVLVGIAGMILLAVSGVNMRAVAAKPQMVGTTESCMRAGQPQDYFWYGVMLAITWIAQVVISMWIAKNDVGVPLVGIVRNATEVDVAMMCSVVMLLEVFAVLVSGLLVRRRNSST